MNDKANKKPDEIREIKENNNKKIIDKILILISPKTFTAIGGYIFLAVSAFAFTILVYQHLKTGSKYNINEEEIAENIWGLINIFSSHIIVIATGIISAIIGYTLLRTAGAALKEVIPDKDADFLYELLKEGNSKALNYYVKLASLSGIEGTFTKLGITGLPLATITLTAFFAILGLIPGTENANFFDLAKLTLGAFIGSFVQKAKSKEEESETKFK